VGPRALRLARKLEPDFILGHSHYTAALTRRCRTLLGIPAGVKLFGVMDLVHTEWSRLRYLFKNFEQIVALRNQQDVWIVLDDGTRGDELLRARGIPADRIRFLPNGLDLEWQTLDIDRSSARDRLALDPDAEVVLFLARLVPSKRPGDVVRAAARICEKRPHAVFLFAGDGEERAACERRASELGVADHVRFAGSVAHESVPELMAAADVFVTTSSLTNMALPTCEALICGVPVVAYDTGDTERVVRNGETGTMVSDGDVDALAEAVSALLADPETRARMSGRARELARELFTSWEDRVAMELDIIEGLIRNS
jgi:glycosyltransferase involved in cell wall biosynthesis